MNDRGGRASAPRQTPTRSGGPESLAEPDHPTLLAMIGFVAASVAVTILVFFGIGYVFGRLFL